MSDNLPKDYNKASQLLESFSCFVEKLAYFSEDPNKNLEKVASFKKLVYFNTQSRSKVQELLTTTFKGDFNFTKPAETLTHYNSVPLLDKTHKKVYSTIDISQPSIQSESSFSATLPTIVINKDKTATTSSSNKVLQDLNNSVSPSWASLETSDDFLVQVKASMHVDNDEILTFIPSFSQVRSFSQPPDSVFYALCFAFFERYVQSKFDEPRISLSQELRAKLEQIDSDMETLGKYLDKQILSLIKTNTGKPTSQDYIIQRFYEDLTSNSNFYSSCLLLFKKILQKILEKKGLESLSRKTSFRWMSELSSTDQAFYEGVASIFEANLRFFVLSTSKLGEKTFSSKGGPQYSPMFSSKAPKQDLNVFIDKSSGYAYILYQPKDVLNNGSLFLVSPSKKTRQRSHSPGLANDTGAMKEIPTTLPNIVNDDKRSFLVPSEGEEVRVQKENESAKLKKGANIPGPNLVPVANKLYSKAPDSSPLDKVGKADISQEEKDELLSNRGNLMSLYSTTTTTRADTSPGYSSKNKENSNTNTNNPQLVPKERELAPSRPSDYMNFKDTASLVNKIMDEINQKVKVGKPEPNIPLQMNPEKKSSSKGRETSAEKDPYLLNRQQSKGHTRTLGDTEEMQREKNRSFDVNLARDKESKALELPFFKQPMVIPAQFKTKFNGINKDLLNHNQEFNQLILRHMKDENMPKSTSTKPQMSAMLAIYGTIMSNSDKNIGAQPSIGTTLQMDT